MPPEPFKNEIRFRINGIMLSDDDVLLVEVKSPITEEYVWMPPGGGLQFGESTVTCLKREFREETGLNIAVDDFCFINELVNPPFHAVELYFKVEMLGGTMSLGKDPELNEADQLLKDIRWFSIDELNDLNLVPQQLVPWLQDILNQ